MFTKDTHPQKHSSQCILHTAVNRLLLLPFKSRFWKQSDLGQDFSYHHCYFSNVSKGSSLDGENKHESGLLGQILSNLNRRTFTFATENGLESKISLRWCKNLPVRSSLVLQWVLTVSRSSQPTPACGSRSPSRLWELWHMEQAKEAAFLQTRGSPPTADDTHQSSSMMVAQFHTPYARNYTLCLPKPFWKLLGKQDFSFTFFFNCLTRLCLNSHIPVSISNPYK